MTIRCGTVGGGAGCACGALRRGALCARARSKGPTPRAVDTLLAATAERHGLTLATRNVADLEGGAALVVNPWRYEVASRR